MALRLNTTAEVDPISRIEGHLGVKVTTDASGYITDARAHGNLWRGFENFLLGRDINDAITYVQRICGVCPVPHGQTSTFAVDTVLGYSKGHITFKDDGTYGIPEKAVLIRNLVLSAEFLMSSITHFYHLAAPSYVQGPAIPPWTPFFAQSYYHLALRNPGGTDTVAGTTAVPKAPGDPAMTVWDAVILSYVRALKVRRMTFEAGALFAGRMPMTSCLVGGGVANAGTDNLTDRVNKFESIIREVALFIVREYVPIALTLGYLYTEYDNKFNNGKTASDPDVGAGWGVGAGLGRFLAWGAFPTMTDTLATPGGYYDAAATADNWKASSKDEIYATFLADTDATGELNADGSAKTRPLFAAGDPMAKYNNKAVAVKTHLLEDISHSRYGIATVDKDAYAAHGNVAAYPGDVKRTKPVRANGYTYMKAPRWNGKPCEVGPLARLVVAGVIKPDGTLYRVSASSAALGVAGYDAYVKTGSDNTTVGLDPKMIDSDIATALVNAGFASVKAGVITGTVTDWIYGLKGGLSTMDRLRGRALESIYLVQKMVGSVYKDVDGNLAFNNDGWTADLRARTGTPAKDYAGSTWKTKTIPAGPASGWGATEAPRGALMHQTTINNGRIESYQAIVPTTWNGSPMDSLNQHGAIEAAVIGAPFSDAGATFTSQLGGAPITTQGGVEVLRIAQSFDPCIACAIH